MKPRVVLIGAGNLAWHLGQRLHEKGFPILQVFSRNLTPARELAQELEADPIVRLAEAQVDADWYILAIADDAIAAVAQKLAINGNKTALYTHTSGSTPSTLLQSFFDRFGVFYPLQTFSKDRKPDFSQIPICVEAHDSKDRELLLHWAAQISETAIHLTDRQRGHLHLAAVFVNNFPNFLFSIGEKILTEEKIDSEILRPLILETAQKVQDHPASGMQTGPAVRADLRTIQTHLEKLKNHPEWEALYRTLSRLINPDLPPIP
jgi:predicted short-subunit dehydrogenase-like oxidoreductase (DUF2520 family)